MILSGEKTSTWRLFDDKDLQMGDEFEFINRTTGEKFGMAKIISVKEKKLGEISESDFEGHEQYKDKVEIMRTYRSYYGDAVNEDTIVKIVNFEMAE